MICQQGDTLELIGYVLVQREALELSVAVFLENALKMQVSNEACFTEPRIWEYNKTLKRFRFKRHWVFVTSCFIKNW